jgi:hypothetical protein
LEDTALPAIAIPSNVVEESRTLTESPSNKVLSVLPIMISLFVELVSVVLATEIPTMLLSAMQSITTIFFITIFWASLWMTGC